jgi:hypothetical protein
LHAGRVHTRQGDLARARPPLSRACSLAQELTIGFLIPWAALDLSALSVLEGRAKDALSLVPAAPALQNGLEWWEALAELRLGEALLAAGRINEARAAGTRALDLARERGEQGHEACALRLLGEVAIHPGAAASDVAEGHYRQALALAERLDMRPLVAHCHRGLAHLDVATAMYREMGMRFWLEPAGTAHPREST